MNDKYHKTTFLSLPLEIRLLIYERISDTFSIRQTSLSRWYPMPIHCQYILRGIIHNRDSSVNDATLQSTAKLHSSYRRLFGLPTSFLQTNSQIYREVRLIPFLYNEFVFVNWLESGLCAAAAFIRALASWQRSALRFMRFEVPARDIIDGAGYEELHDLGEGLAYGVRGLRIKLVLYSSTVASIPMASRTSNSMLKGEEQRPEVVRRWLLEGLGVMSELQKMEIEVVSQKMGDKEKVRWCEMLEELLRGKGLKRVEVMCVEKIQERMEWIKCNVGWKALIITVV